VCAALETERIIAGLDLGRIDARFADRLLIAVTEKHRREDLDRLVEALGRASAG
jgi:glycine dehydrogenase subunit 1